MGHPGTRPPLTNAADRALLRITWPFLLIVVALVLLASESLTIVSATRAFVGGESLWSKAQKEAVYSLFRYAQSRAESDYRDYLDAVAVPLGDRRARLELEKEAPDLAVAREGFIAGRNDPDDVDGMIMLFRRFRHVSFMSRAIDIWAQGDELIAALVVAAEELHAQIRSGDVPASSLGPVLLRIDDINRRLTPLGASFSGTLGEASRRTQEILEVLLVFVAAALGVVGIALSRRMLRTSAALEAQLHAERDRAQVTLQSIAEGVITTDERGRIETLNPVAEALTGWTRKAAVGRPLEEVFDIIDETNRKARINPVATLLDGGRGVELRGDAILIRRDGREVGVDASAAPIRDRDGAIIGAVLVFYDVTDERRFAAQLSHQARHDALTGLPNRREFEHRLQRALAAAAELDRRHAMLYLDLDRFKEVNDACGHAAGDELLREISLLLQRKLREGDTLARLGGDEFGVLLENCAPDHAARIAEALRDAVAQVAFECHGRSFTLGVSVGLVPIAAGPHTEADIMNAADANCYQAKAFGRGRVHVGDVAEKPRDGS
ncbi:MAG TPA: diguanylate cyclase [Casimicrobiaceae bacterium]|nr:diguanylate cyclase [Casimicrobiaceae bacterium]